VIPRTRPSGAVTRPLPASACFSPPPTRGLTTPISVLLAVAALTAVMAASASAASGDPQREPTRAGMARAKSVLLTASDLGAGWLSGRATNPGHITSTCTGPLKANESDLVEIGTAAEYSSRGVSVIMQSAAVYGTASEGNAAWSRTLAASIPHCMRKALQSIGVDPIQEWRLHLALVSSAVAGYRIVGVYKAYDQLVVMYFDQVLIRRDATVTRLFLTTFARPFRQSFEESIVREIATRLSAGPVASGPSA
jgi:hypothetical protein